jgi:hypothetical protein
MIVEFKLSGYFIDKPVLERVSIDDNADAVELPDSTILKVRQLKGDALEQYIFASLVKNTRKDGRVISYSIL